MNAWKQIAKSLLQRAVPRDWLLVRGPHSTSQPSVALTFDDGPDPAHTPALLDELLAANLRATFFVIGSRAKQYPELVRRIVREGHLLANHTWTHNEPATVSTTQFRQEVTQTEELLRPFVTDSSSPLSANKLRYLRPPKGELTAGKLLAAWRLKHTVALWSLDPRDYRCTNMEEARQTAAEQTPQAGDVVLLHDNHPYATEMLRTWRAAGVFAELGTVTLDQWCHTSQHISQSSTTRQHKTMLPASPVHAEVSR